MSDLEIYYYLICYIQKNINNMKIAIKMNYNKNEKIFMHKSKDFKKEDYVKNMRIQ